MTALIFPEIDFANLKQNSLSKWSQLSRMEVNRSSLVDKFTIKFRSGLFTGHIINWIMERFKLF